MAIKYDHTRNCAAEVAEEVCKLFKEGKRGSYTFNGITFTLTDVGLCSKFVRSCCEASSGGGAFSLPYFGVSALETEAKLKAANKRVAQPNVGDIICFNKNSGQYGHIGIYIGEGKFAENTSSNTRGPGFVISELSEMTSRITGYYSILPMRHEEIQTVTIKIVNHDSGEIVNTYEMVEGGDHIKDQQKVYIK